MPTQDTAIVCRPLSDHVRLFLINILHPPWVTLSHLKSLDCRGPQSAQCERGLITPLKAIQPLYTNMYLRFQLIKFYLWNKGMYRRGKKLYLGLGHLLLPWEIGLQLFSLPIALRVVTAVRMPQPVLRRLFGSLYQYEYLCIVNFRPHALSVIVVGVQEELCWR